MERAQKNAAYEALGLIAAENHNYDTVHKKYQKLMLTLHPDRRKSNSEYEEARYFEVSEAYTLLKRLRK